MTRDQRTERPARLNRERVLRAAVAIADREGIDAVRMRHLADDLGVVPMAIYKHVADKDELLAGMVDVIIQEIGPPAPADERWKPAVRARILTARDALHSHAWARGVMESRTSRTPTVLAYLDSIAYLFLTGGLSADLVHHAMHAVGSRVWGFTQDLFDTGPETTQPASDPATRAALAARLPHLAVVAAAVDHDAGSTVGRGCDDQFEFEFALDILLDGIERLHAARWTSSRPLPPPQRRRRAQRNLG